MIKHIVMFFWKEGVSADQISDFNRDMTEMMKLIPDVVAATHGPDLEFREGNANYILTATFKDEAGWKSYQDNPIHKAFIRDRVAPILSHRVAGQISD
ncbi:Dabb family protein [Ancylobacter sp. IITR112]|uniref:Dabb family protein n=1 Tax=Ancylobacter sp. IITR112 TaxID=3138073 RepID=UPI00352ADF32